MAFFFITPVKSERKEKAKRRSGGNFIDAWKANLFSITLSFPSLSFGLLCKDPDAPEGKCATDEHDEKRLQERLETEREREREFDVKSHGYA